jgi:hypothetical protein
MEESNTTKTRVRQGKRRQRFTQREIARVDRAAPARTIVLRPDGALVLLPPAGRPDASPRTHVGDDTVVIATGKSREKREAVT